MAVCARVSERSKATGGPSLWAVEGTSKITATESDLFFIVCAGVFGATVGSFLNVLIYRIPRPEAKSFGSRSRCPECRTPIPAYLNLPIVGWLMLGGKARCCGVRIPVRYPLVEALCAGLFAALAVWPPSGMGMSLPEPEVAALIAFAFHGFFVANLLANTFIDFDFRILPDRLTKPLMVVGILASLALPGFVGNFGWLKDQRIDGLVFSLVGLGVGYLLTDGVRQGARMVFGKEAMGYGDVKLMAGIGAFLGWDGAVTTFFVGCVLGAVVGMIHKAVTRDPYIAFGPYLAMGAVLTLFLGDSIVVFLTQTWPRWQREYASSPWVALPLVLLCIFFLVFLIRRGRSR